MIKMTFKKGGGVVVAPQGYEGATCHEATRPYEDALEGRKVVKNTEGNSTGVAATNQNRLKAGQ